MDAPRPRRSRWRGRVLLAGVLAGLGMITAALGRARPAAPKVDRAAIWVDTVRRGTLTRQVRGFGALVPEEIRSVTAPGPGRVERIALLPGVAVQADTVLMELANPEIAESVLELAATARAAAAERDRLRLEIEGERLAEEAAIARLGSELAVARFEAEGDARLAADGFGSELAARRSRAKADELAGRLALEHRRQTNLARSGLARLAVEEAEMAKIAGQLRLRRSQLQALTVRAGIDGVLQRLGDAQPLREGEQVAAGAALARIASQARLRAQIRIPESQAKDVRIGQEAAIDTRNGVVPGHVVRVDPAVADATVTVDVALDGPPPPGSRPDLSVDATITLERLDGVLHVGRPTGVEAQSHARLFKLVDGGRAAARVPVRFGRSSVDTIEIAAGLEAGDQLVTSDMAGWDAHDLIRLD
jgi:HlyD family secretion protein